MIECVAKTSSGVGDRIVLEGVLGDEIYAMVRLDGGLK